MREPVDPDVDLHVPAQRSELSWPTIGAISAGGVAGSLVRYGLGVLFPSAPGFPWTTLAINVTGCLLIGVLMVAITEIWSAPPWVRPLLGVGVLGGYTTFSTYIADVGLLFDGGAPREALIYLLVTPLLALAAVWAGAAATRRLGGRAR
ncbi:fluoride efflux transporter FluC [Herbidospora cretacea]|uniref:fluoride efflux transporter FluC n=1 Tax=Herbidospora cretacea TaxID=28444 RepID=UPI0007746EF8|nr:CrcB family protein [Herbidospora cretacea]